MWCIPEASAEYVACMEDVLEQYEQGHDPRYPLVCYDEWVKQLVEVTRPGIPAKPGRVQRLDYEYKRHGVRNLLVSFEPLTGKRHVQITRRRTMREFSAHMKWLVDDLFPEALRVRVVLDQLNTHRPAALYESFPPAEARRILRRLEFHHTPKHGSWLNMAEIELSVIGRKLKHYIPDDHRLEREVRALVEQRNGSQASVNWQFRTEDARIKLKQLYPSISD